MNIINAKILVERKYSEGEHSKEDKNFKGNFFGQKNVA